MSDELRVELATALGWKFDGPPSFGHDGKWHIFPYQDEPVHTKEMSEWAGEPKDPQIEYSWLPSLSDLVTQAERRLSDEQRHAYVSARWKLSPLREELWRAYWEFDQQSPDDRAKALIQVLRG